MIRMEVLKREPTIPRLRSLSIKDRCCYMPVTHEIVILPALKSPDQCSKRQSFAGVVEDSEDSVNPLPAIKYSLSAVENSGEFIDFVA